MKHIIEKLEEEPSVSADFTTFRVSDFLGWQRDGSLILRPHFQRGSVWKAKDKSFLIDSVLRGYPIPLVILQEEYDIHDASKVKKRVVDGQQRLRTLISYIDRSSLDDVTDADHFAYTPPDPSTKDVAIAFSDLSEKGQRRILQTRISAVILQANTGDSAALEVYDRLNSTGMSLGGQELRFARRPGPFSELCYRLARRNQRRWSTWRLMRDEDIARMREVEFTSELVLLLLDGIQKTGKKEIDDAYSERALDEAQAQYAEASFQLIMDRLDLAYGTPGSPDPIRAFRTRAWFYSVFSLMMFDMGLLDADGDRTSLDTGGLFSEERFRAEGLLDPNVALRRAAHEYAVARKSNPELATAVSGAASDRRARRRRFEFLTAAVIG